MLIIPAIDLYQGKVVRLTMGNIRQLKVYSDNPILIAKHWQNQGAKLLHIVDLSAALGEGDNLVTIKDMIKKTKVKVEVGGGINTLKKAKELISIGAERIIIGTKALEEDFVEKMLNTIGNDKVAVSVDVFGNFLAIKGWRKKTKIKVDTFIYRLKKIGVKWIIYTDILKDGTLLGASLNILEKLAVFRDLNIIFSGGISSLEDVKKIREKASFLKGIILGKALYENKISLSQLKNF